MKIERAIELLNRISDSQFDGIHGDERREALEMAVRALEGDGDMISRQAVTKFLNDWLSCLFENCHKQSASDLKMIIKDFKNLPSAQPERNRGRWIKLDMHAHIADHKCTACGEECYVPTCMGEPMYAYCPNCGARMEGESDE